MTVTSAVLGTLRVGPRSRAEFFALAGTLRAFADHGQVPGDSIRDHHDDVTTRLENNGVAAFDAAWQELGDQLAAQLRHPAGRPAREESGT